LRNRILKHPGIVDGSMSKSILFENYGRAMTNWGGGNPEEKSNVVLIVSYDFVKNMGINVIAGRDFSRNFVSDIGHSCLINETAAKFFGRNNPIGCG
jgi:putative ABC transport system permease protein